MHKIKNVTRLGVVLTTLGVIALAFASRASAAVAMVPRSGGNDGTLTPPVPAAPPAVVRTVVVGGMPGWQIAVIAIAAALIAAIAAVLVDRIRSVRRRVSGASA